MSHPLDGARLKIVRAQEQLQSLKDEISRYLDRNPYVIPVEDHDNAVTARAAVVTEEPPLRLGCIFGECLGSLRESLDYITWELACRYAATKPVVGKNRDIYFPIYDDPPGKGPDRFADTATKYAFPTDAVTLIEAIQPQKTGYGLLRFFSDTVNMKKHCVPLMTLATANTAWINLQHPESAAILGVPGGGAMIIRKVAPEDLDEFGMQTEASRLRDMAMLQELMTKTQQAARPGPAVQEARTVKVDGQVTVFVTVKNPPVPNEPADRTLEQIVKCVADIIPRFEQFFL